MGELRKKLIRLAYEKPEFRPAVMSLLKKEAYGRWQLYNKPGVKEAERELDAGLERATKETVTNIKKFLSTKIPGRPGMWGYENDLEDFLFNIDRSTGWKLYNIFSSAVGKYLDPLMKKYEDLGALDSEPLSFSRYAIASALAKELGGNIQDWADALD